MKQKQSKTTRRSNVVFRVTDSERKRLEREAVKYNCKVSGYIREKLFEDGDKKNQISKNEKAMISEILAIVQDICGHIEEKYTDKNDVELEEFTEKLWKKLQ